MIKAGRVIETIPIEDRKYRSGIFRKMTIEPSGCGTKRERRRYA
jgi:hypothetical protein